MKVFEIWAEGYIVPECHARAMLMGRQEAETFEQACDLFFENLTENRDCYRKREDGTPVFWGCRLFDNEADARIAYG